MSLLKEVGLNGVIDVHTHSGGVDLYNTYTGNLPQGQSVDDLLLKARLSGVEKVVTFPFPSSGYYDTRHLIETQQRRPSGLQDFPYQIENMALLRSCQDSLPMVLPFVCVDPGTKATKQIDNLRRQYDQQKFYGLKLHTLATSSTAIDLIGSGFIDFAAEKNIPLMIHSGFPDKYSDPKNIIEASKYNQNVRFCIAHLAWLDEESITKVKNSKNVFLDCSPFIQICNKVRNGSSSVRKPNLIDPSQPVASLLRYQSLLRDSLVWGSDEPWTKCIGPNGKITSNHSYFDEVDILASAFKAEPDAIIAMTSKNTSRFLFG